MVMFNGGNTFDLTGGWGAALTLAVASYYLYTSALCVETIIAEDEGKDTVVFGNSILMRVVWATLAFVSLLVVPPPYFFGFSSEALETIVKPLLAQWFPGFAQTGALAATGTVSMSMLVATLLFEKNTRLGSLSDINTKTIEGLFASDLNYLQSLYEKINGNGVDAVDEAMEAQGQAISSRGLNIVGER